MHTVNLSNSMKVQIALQENFSAIFPNNANRVEDFKRINIQLSRFSKKISIVRIVNYRRCQKKKSAKGLSNFLFLFSWGHIFFNNRSDLYRKEVYKMIFLG